MNCENYQVLISDLVDGVLTAEDCQRVELHLSACPDCADARSDLSAIVEFCHEHRGEYEAVPNEHTLWLRISNIIEAEIAGRAAVDMPSNTGRWSRLMNRSWQLSFPELAASVVAIVVLVSVVTTFGVRRMALLSSAPVPSTGNTSSSNASVEDRYRQQQETIAYWNQRVELNKARWSQQMRDTFDKNMSVIDSAVNESMSQLRIHPHDEVSEEILNDALNDKISLLKEFGDL